MVKTGQKAQKNKKKTSTLSKPKIVEKPIQVYPQYQNQEDIPVWEPDQANLNKQKQINLKKKNRDVPAKKQNKNKYAKKSIRGTNNQQQQQQLEHEDQYEDVEMDQELQNYEDDQNEQNYQENQYEEGDNFQNQIEGGEEMDQEQPQNNQDQMVDEQEVDYDDGAIQQQGIVQEKGKQDYSMVNMKIQEILAVLGNFQRLAEHGKTRKDYLEELKSHLQSYYNYNSQLIDHFLTFLNPNQLIQFFEANQTHRPLTIRINTLKTRRKQLAQALLQRGVDLDKLAEWSKVGIKIYQSRVPIGATPEYLAGHYMLQSASSLLPVLALDPQPNQKILDLAAAPGGKTTYVAQLMKNTGVIFANDVKKERLRALQFNVQRLGISNVIVTNYDGRKITKAINNFDRVLLDAPCTGLGIISKDHSIKVNKVLMDIRKHSHLQKQLILAAIDSTKPHGVIVYSTCSVSPLQNQEVVNFALKRRHVKLVDIEIEVGQPGYTKYVDKRFHPDVIKTKRIYPHIHNMDGFYVAKFVKLAHGKKNVQGEKQEQVQQEVNENKEEEKDFQKIKTKKISKNKSKHNVVKKSV